MSDNLFSFPGESTGQDAGDFFGGAGGVAFTDLGSADEVENPFTKMTPPTEAPASGEAASVTPSPAPGQQAQDQLGTTQTPPPAAPPAVPASAETPKTPPAQTTEETNPLLAAMDLQEKKNAAKTAAPIFAQLPVFSYNGSEEPIENVDQTFEELRLAKADDFPEFDEAQSISWTVTYGKIVKNVATPRKTKIGNLKREIESSKEFMDALKKAADKRPKCIVKPKVTMQKKGECAYKGIFPRLADARASKKAISFIPAQDGRVYERRVTCAGEFITPTSGVRYLDDIRAGFAPALPLIPYSLMEQAVTLFRCLMDNGKGGCPLEALVHIYWDREEKRFFLYVPTQTVGKRGQQFRLMEKLLQRGQRPQRGERQPLVGPRQTQQAKIPAVVQHRGLLLSNVGVNVTEGDIGRLHFSHVTEGLKKKSLVAQGKNHADHRLQRGADVTDGQPQNCSANVTDGRGFCGENVTGGHTGIYSPDVTEGQREKGKWSERIKKKSPASAMGST